MTFETSGNMYSISWHCRHTCHSLWCQCCHCNSCFRSSCFSQSCWSQASQKLKRMMMMCHLSSGVYLLRNGDIECWVGMNQQHWLNGTTCLSTTWSVVTSSEVAILDLANSFLLIQCTTFSWDLLHLMFESFYLCFGNQLARPPKLLERQFLWEILWSQS